MNLLFLLTLACVSKKDFAELQGTLTSTEASHAEQLAERDARITSLEGALEQEQAKSAALGADIARLTGEIESLNAEKAALVSDRSRLRASVTEMEQALNELAERKRLSEQRIEEYRDLLARFQSLIDSGRLDVQIIDGRMVVRLATDILFASGSAELSEDGTAALTEVAEVLTSLSERQYQVEGHTDNVPIQTQKYPSNWDLAAGRAIVVTRTLTDAGLSPNRISAASYAQFKPVASNDTKEGRAQNRRIEIVIMPDLSTLPGFDELNEIADDSTDAVETAP
ncbi:MAG: OmpA family protein [Myxococcota bacterium]